MGRVYMRRGGVTHVTCDDLGEEGSKEQSFSSYCFLSEAGKGRESLACGGVTTVCLTASHY